ncbi:MAG: hypothetical protein FWE20_00440 [Defluviitaleaceae bacterium]|nr:hypothetical protein [Defluviitaleaceae bacterium]
MISGMNFNPIGGNNWWSMNSGFANNSNTMLGGLMMPPRGTNMANTSSNFQASILNVRNNAENLRTSLNNILGTGRNTTSPFVNSRPVSANNDRMEITGFDANRLRNANVSNFSVEVVQVAQAQRNEGANLNAAALASDTGFTVGSHQMTLNVGGRNFDINFNVSATDTNRDVQQRIASAINSRNAGVTASVSLDSAAGTSALVLQSSETGVDRAGQPNFTVSGGNALAMTGVGGITQEAQNAAFRVNRGFTGALQTSRSNDVSLGFGINAQLRETGTVAVNMTRDETAQINSMRDMVNNFNALMQSAQDSSTGRGMSRLEQQLTGLVTANSASLSRIGISMNRDGFMQIDQDRMRSAAESGALERFVADGGRGGNFGFVNRLARTVDNAIRNPAGQINNPQNNNQFNNRHMRQMNQLMNTGMLFNSWF